MTERLVVEGGVRLEGDVRISGAKNAALPLLAATLLVEHCIIENIPKLKDTQTMMSVLRHMGVHCTLKNSTLETNAEHIQRVEAPYELVRMMRASVLVLGPLLARHGQVRVSMPGGCAIGARPVEQHLKGLAALGAHHEMHEGFIELKAPNGLKGASYTFEHITVTGTENLVMAATLAKGTTVLKNVALEPEIVNLCDALRAMGAQIEGDGTSEIIIEGVTSLKDAKFSVISDRIEAASYLIMAAATRGSVRALGAQAEHMGAVLEKLREAGAHVEEHPDWVRVSSSEQLRSVSIRTKEFPGFPTDVQAQICAMNLLSKGSAVIEERIFENRYMHCQELLRLNANIQIDSHRCVIHGVKSLKGATLKATDLRAGFACLIAGVMAEGETTIESVYHIDRGYESIEDKLTDLGVQIFRTVAHS